MFSRRASWGQLVTYALEPGTDVEVQSSFDRDWKRGFVVEGACPQGYHLRRRSDGSVLPTTFPPEVVRPVSSPQAFR